ATDGLVDDLGGARLQAIDVGLLPVDHGLLAVDTVLQTVDLALPRIDLGLHPIHARLWIFVRGSFTPDMINLLFLLFDHPLPLLARHLRWLGGGCSCADDDSHPPA